MLFPSFQIHAASSYCIFYDVWVAPYVGDVARCSFHHSETLFAQIVLSIVVIIVHKFEDSSLSAPSWHSDDLVGVIFRSRRGLITSKLSNPQVMDELILYLLLVFSLLFHISLTDCLLLVACFYLNRTLSLVTHDGRALVWITECERNPTAIPALIKILLRN